MPVAHAPWREALAFCALIAVGTIARDFASPFKSRTDLRYRDFARWFWFNMEFAGEAVCLKSDLGEEFAPGTFRDLGWSAMYLCNQRIYSPRHARGEAAAISTACRTSGPYAAWSSKPRFIGTTRPPLSAGWPPCNCAGI